MWHIWELCKVFCLLHTQNDQDPSQMSINKDNDCFGECVTHTRTHNSLHPLYAFMEHIINGSYRRIANAKC